MSLFKEHNPFRGKKVLVFGFGIQGGGLATTNWLLKQGAKVTVTDLKSEAELAPALAKIKGKVTLRLGGHDRLDIVKSDIVIVNPDVPSKNEFVRFAYQQGKRVENEATIFYRYFSKPIVGVTGTRGKTTTVTWLNHLLTAKFATSVAGNSQSFPFLSVLENATRLDCAVTEMPSFHLELFEKAKLKPDIALITNIYQDHFNRYPKYEDYVKTKANLYRWQTSKDHLILNFDNRWTPFLRARNLKSQLWYFSIKKLPQRSQGLFYQYGSAVLQEKGEVKKVLDLGTFGGKWGNHNVENVLGAALAAHIRGVEWFDIQAKLATLPQVAFREEIIYDDGHIKIINDTTATSPEGTIAAVKRFGSPTTILITGGTDRKLAFANWGKLVPTYVIPENMIFLSGSATDKMLRSLEHTNKPYAVFDTLEDCLMAALMKAASYRESVILFSPSSKSFEKFKNEYDRGEKFNALVVKVTKKPSRSR